MKGSFESSEQLKHAHDIGTLREDRVDIEGLINKKHGSFESNEEPLLKQINDAEFNKEDRAKELHNLSYSMDQIQSPDHKDFIDGGLETGSKIINTCELVSFKYQE